MMMKLAAAAVVCGALVAEAFVSQSSPRGSPSFVTSSPRTPTPDSSLNYKKGSSEAPEIDYSTRQQLERLLLKDGSEGSLKAAEAKHGMPWKTSIDTKAFQGEELLYMPFWEWQMKFLQENLTDLKVLACMDEDGDTDFSFNENKDKKARIVNLCLSSKEYRKIRLTYYDAGDNTQVFNAVLYPDPAYNLPVLGIDLLAFNRKKYLAIVDFQPLHQDESKHDLEFSHILQPIKESYDNLKGRMSSKFYDETQFFSEQMLFSRFEDESIITNELFPAFQQYVQTHLDLIRQCDGGDASQKPQVLERQQAYDRYSAERDPATGLFTAMFGQDWAMGFVHDFLFSMSEKPAAGAAAPIAASGGGGNPYASGGAKPSSVGGGNPFAAGPKPQEAAVGARTR